VPSVDDATESHEFVGAVLAFQVRPESLERKIKPSASAPAPAASNFVPSLEEATATKE
jgi:hypothetical protein